MILTITLNPSVDYLYQLEHFKIGTTNRIPKTIKMVGGKGINAARICTILDQPTIATGIIAGTSGDYILRGMDVDHIKHSFLRVDGESRNCITILHDNGIQTELMEQGPYLHAPEFLSIREHIHKVIRNHSISVIGISGSVNTKDKKIYAKLINEIILAFPHIKIVVDTSEKLLRETLVAKNKPFFIKPNLEEINELLHTSIVTEAELIEVLDNPLFNGVYGILVSLGAKGGLAKVNHQFFRLSIPEIQVISPEGSGDSTVGGLLTGINRQLNDSDLLRYSMAAGMSNAQQSKTGFMEIKDFEHNFNQINVEKIESVDMSNLIG
ncbi:MAG: hexose kinase [Sporolactobacillus sp.]